MSLLGVGQFVSGVLAEVGLEEGFHFRKSEVEIRQRLELESKRLGLNIEQAAPRDGDRRTKNGSDNQRRRGAR